MPYVMGDRGDIVAILWADYDPLHTPPQANINNKILWVSKMIPGGPFTRSVFRPPSTAPTRP
jgi:hypothetical protein